MENHDSCEKLVGVAAGLEKLELPKPVASGKRAKKRSWKCRDGVFTVLGIAMVFVISYEIWQAVRGERLLRDIEYKDAMMADEIAMQLVPEETGADKTMILELEKLRNELKEMQKKLNQREPTTEAPTTPPFEPSKMINVFEQSPDSMPTILEPMFDVPNVDVGVKAIDPVIVEDDSGLFWRLRINVASGFAGEDSEEKPIVTESSEAETDDTSESSEEDASEDKPPTDRWWGWGWKLSNVDEDDIWQPNIAEDVTETIAEVEPATVLNTTTVEPIILPFPLTSDYYSGYDSYEYDYEEDKTSASTESGGERESSMESTSSVSTTTEDAKRIEDVPTTESTSTQSAPKLYVFRTQLNYEVPSYFDALRSLPQTLSQSLGLDENSNDEEEKNVTSEQTDQISQDSSNVADQFSPSERIDQLRAELERQQIELLKVLTKLQRSNRMDALDTTESSSSDDFSWSYISKRSAEMSAEFESSPASLTTKEFDHKISLIEQAIDNDNHLIENQVSLTSGPNKQILREKLDRFYAKMEAVSAHIDRLHAKYLRLNKLEDDYVSREFSSEENRHVSANESDE